MTTPHRLATILFADIQGYTALMERDENKALSWLRIFQSSLEKDVVENNGTIQNFYGDGCLATFHGSTDAINCAIQLQKVFWTEHSIPVRIGLHTGEVVVDGVNVYGNAVNIASRIESIGIPGSILLSQLVANQVSNNLNVKMTSLGIFEFKNVTKAIEVMAISDFGFQVPKRENIQGKLKYPSPTEIKSKIQGNQLTFSILIILIIFFAIYIFSGDTFNEIGSTEVAENGLYIPPFKNQTGDSTLDNIGSYSSMVIANAIQSSGLAIVREKATLDIGTNLLEAKLPTFGTIVENDFPEDIRFVLDGVYNKTSDTLNIITRIIDLKTNTTIQVFPIISGIDSTYSMMIEQLKDVILGYWATRDLPLYKYNPPDYQAYIEYLLAIEHWEGDTAIILKHIRNCKKRDSTFYRAHLLELELYEVYDPRKAESMLDRIELIKPGFSDAELTLYNSIKARIRNRNQAAYTYYMQEFEKAPRNLFVNTSAISIALALVNNPQKAVEIAEYIDWKVVPYNDCDYCQDRLTFLTKAYIDIGKEEKALNILNFAENTETDLINRGLKELEIRALARLGRIDQIKEVLQKSRYQDFNQQLDVVYFTYWAARECILTGNMEAANQFATDFLAEINADNRNSYITTIGRMHLYLENYEQAIVYLKESLDSIYLGGYLPYFEAWYAAAQGFSGNTTIANEFLQKFSDVEDKYEKPLYLYNKAIIYCSLGEIDQAISSLKEAIYAGKRFYRWEFQYEPILKKYIPEKNLNEILTSLN